MPSPANVLGEALPFLSTHWPRVFVSPACPERSRRASCRRFCRVHRNSRTPAGCWRYAPTARSDYSPDCWQVNCRMEPRAFEKEPIMPLINGRFYANPLFGRAVERAREAEGGRVWSEQRSESERQSPSHASPPRAAPHPKHENPRNTESDSRKTVENKARVGYGETSGLLPQKSADAKRHSPYDRSTWDQDSFDSLQEARRNIMDVSERNPRFHRAKPSVDANSIDRSIWSDNRGAASKSDGTLPGKYIFIRQAGVGPQRPPKKAGYGQTAEPMRSYGPFTNIGGGDVPKGDRTYIDIYDR